MAPPRSPQPGQFSNSSSSQYKILGIVTMVVAALPGLVFAFNRDLPLALVAAIALLAMGLTLIARSRRAEPAGVASNPVDALVSPDWRAAMSRTTRELVKYTPEHFKQIHCEIRKQGGRSGQKLTYKIGCPDYPDESTSTPGKDLEAACLDLVACYEQRGATFPGISISVEVLPDGRSRNSFELLNP